MAGTIDDGDASSEEVGAEPSLQLFERLNNGNADATRKWADEVMPRFPVLVQNRFSVSNRYEVFATPFAFLIDERGVIKSKGTINNKQNIGFVLSGAGDKAANGEAETETVGAEAEVL